MGFCGEYGLKIDFLRNQGMFWRCRLVDFVGAKSESRHDDSGSGPSRVKCRATQ